MICCFICAEIVFLFLFQDSFTWHLNFLSAPTTTWASSAFNFHCFPNSILKSCYLPIFSCSFTMINWSPHMVLLMIRKFFVILSMHTISGRLCSNPTRFCILQSPALNQEHLHTICHYILGGTFCIVGNGFSLLIYHAFFRIGSLPD